MISKGSSLQLEAPIISNNKQYYLACKLTGKTNEKETSSLLKSLKIMPQITVENLDIDIQQATIDLLRQGNESGYNFKVMYFYYDLAAIQSIKLKRDQFVHVRTIGYFVNESNCNFLKYGRSSIGINFKCNELHASLNRQNMFKTVYPLLNPPIFDPYIDVEDQYVEVCGLLKSHNGCKHLDIYFINKIDVKDIDLYKKMNEAKTFLFL